MLFSDKIKQLRLESGKLQKDLAKAIGVDVPAYSRFEHGERRPKRDQVLRLARIFKTDPDELVAAWLADEAYSHIAQDKMATQAAAMLHEMLGGHPAGNQQASATEPAQPAATPVPTATRNLIKRLGRSLMPHYEQGDAATVMQRIEDESIDCIVTTPPYWRRRTQGTESITATSKEDFVNELLQTMAQAWRVLKPQGSLWLNMGDDTTDGFVQGIPWRVVLQMIDNQGWQLVNEVVWNKTTTSPQGSQDHLRKVHEFMFHLVKSDDFYYNDEALRRTFALIMRHEGKDRGKPAKGKQHQGLVPSDVWTIGVQRSGIAHYCVAPDTLYRLPLVATCPRDGIVLDPYCGTGTACKIAYEMNLRSIGIDINAEYIRQARATTEAKPLSLF
ncbi:MAG: helix-turn-helix domain-containing protein [Muribaculaceae bacterium]|jgi:site-specific DNA-methyltransferase (adenine-specific)|nr:helix-turn-helix domain-containing protein [Muribaculaceae bacterium]